MFFIVLPIVLFLALKHAVGALAVHEAQRLLVGADAALVHLGVGHNSPLFNEPEQQSMDSVVPELFVQRFQIESPELLSALHLNVEAAQEVVQMVGVRHNQTAVRALAVDLQTFEGLQRLGANVGPLCLTTVFL